MSARSEGPFVVALTGVTRGQVTCVRSRIWISAAVLIACATTQAHATQLRGGVLANGGVTVGGSGRQLLGSVGQPVVGRSTGENHVLSHGFWCFGGARVVAVDPPGPSNPGVPTVLSFGNPWPNPSRGAVRIPLALPKAARVDLVVFDVQGRQVETVARGVMPPGFHELSWSGPGAGSGASGVYFGRLLVDGKRIGQRRIVCIR